MGVRDVRCAAAVTEEEEEGDAVREGRVGEMGVQGGWARWIVTAGGGGRRVQQGWRGAPSAVASWVACWLLFVLVAF